MPAVPTAVIGDNYTSTESWELLEELVDIENRMAGHEGEARGAELIEDSFECNGLREVNHHTVDFPGWRRGSTTLTVTEPRRRTLNERHQILALPGTPAGEVEAEVVNVGSGTPGDFEPDVVEGKIVMTTNETPEDIDRRLQRYEKYHRAVDAGAVGFLFCNIAPGCLPQTGTANDWADTVNADPGPGEIPGAAISREEGSRLIRYAERGSPRVQLQIDCQNAPATSRNVEGVLGPDTEEEIIVSAHYDAHDISDGARDNGFGSALVAEVGRLLVPIESHLETQVRFITFGAEEFGLYGSHHWAENHDLDNVKCVVNLDGIGYSRDLYVRGHGFDGINAAFKEAGDSFDVPVKTTDEVNMYGDQWSFASRGIPATIVGSVKHGELSGSTAKGWGHTHADTIDKHDVRDFRDLAILLADSVLRFAEADRVITRKSSKEFRDLAVEQGYEDVLKVTGRWQW